VGFVTTAFDTRGSHIAVPLSLSLSSSLSLSRLLVHSISISRPLPLPPSLSLCQPRCDECCLCNQRNEQSPSATPREGGTYLPLQ